MRAMTLEPYKESPNGQRQVFYFDKGRMEITNPNADPHSSSYVSAGLLVRDLIAGHIQVGNTTFIQVTPAQVPVTGDLVNNPLSPTFASLFPIASIEGIGDNHNPNRVGQKVTDLLKADGTVVPGAVPESNVTLGAYDDQIGHNIPKLFEDWLSRQQLPREFLVGHPLTEPFWVDSMVGGKQKRVLMQAFERRVLTYTPDNPANWQVESGNAGLQYRLWRGLDEPGDANLYALASGVPYGETITGKAAQYGIDPFLLAAVAKVSSGYDPYFQTADGRQGFFGVRADFLRQQDYPLDPLVNADVAARKLSEFHQYSSDWRAVLAQYFTGSPHPDWSDPALNSFVNDVLNTEGKLISDLKQPPLTLASQNLRVIGVGHAAFYSPSYTTAWWNGTLQKYASWGNIAAGWSPDPNGYYCVHPGYIPGQRLQLTANGVTLWCTIGDEVASRDLASWQAHWVIELSYNTFQALHLNGNNWVEVRSP